MARNSHLAAVVLRVPPNDLQEIDYFYREVLGFQTKSTEEGSFLSRPARRYWVPSEVHPNESCSVEFRPIAEQGYRQVRRDVYWKIGLALHDVNEAVQTLGKSLKRSVDRAIQFFDIGFLTSIKDPAGLSIELLQTTFETSEERRDELWGKDEQRAYVERVKAHKDVALGSLLGSQPFVVGQITLRTSSKDESLEFYQNVLGMKLLSIQPVRRYDFTLYFLAFTDDKPPNEDDLESVENREWCWERKYTTLELQYFSQSVSLTHNGNPDFKSDEKNLSTGLHLLKFVIRDPVVVEKIRAHSTYVWNEGCQYLRDPNGVKIEIEN